ncbi:hypothetical protein ES703_15243 [subsurface metagenome]
MKYIIYNKLGKILRVVQCPSTEKKSQVHKDEFVMEGQADDITQKIVNGKIVDKTPEEVKADNPSPSEVPESERPARITNKQWQDVQDRLTRLEAKTK